MFLSKKARRRWQKFRNGLVRRFLETRYGRELLVNSLPPRVLDITTDCGDHVLTFSPHDYIGRKVYRKSHFERGGVRRLRQVLAAHGIDPAGKVLLELGGNIGTQTIYWAREGLFSACVSMEPDPRNFALLSRNIRQNGLQGEVTLVNAAAGESEGRIAFFQNPDNHGKSSALRSSPRDRKIEVPVRSVGEVLDENGVHPGDVGLIWMDIEGYEPVACRSMMPLIERSVPLYLEFSPDFYGEQAAGFRAMLAAHYDRAVLFFEDEEPQAARPAEIPLDSGQFDVLLLGPG